MRIPLMIGRGIENERTFFVIKYQDERLRYPFSRGIVFRDREQRMSMLSFLFPEANIETFFIRGLRIGKDRHRFFDMDFMKCTKIDRLRIRRILGITCRFNSYSCYPPFVVGTTFKPYLEFQK